MAADTPLTGESVLPGEHRNLGLTDDEYARIVEILGRAPNPTELAMYAVMWSEHCSYKSSRIHLGRLPSEGAQVIVGPGENAGVVDVGDGIAIALRIESHNHPSFIEPYQGAATGVGGIFRDIFTVGARPIALMDAIFFGPLEDDHSRYIADGVVRGIAGYGNAVGVPTVGGQVTFDATYRTNPLVNVFCLGVLPIPRLVLARASGTGSKAVLLGSRTGRDGIGGVSVLASAGFGGGDESATSAKRPNVQIADPFEEKRLIEACLELLESGLVVGIQDLGGAGLSCRDGRNRRPGRRRHRRRRRVCPPSGAADDACRGDDEREPGTDAGDRRPGVLGEGLRGLRPLGSRGGRDRHGDRPGRERHGPGARPRRGGGRSVR